ncbi:MAG: site-2 protease family protein [Methylobacter sp.]
MSESLLSPQWYRVQALTPRLRKHIEVHRHDYRGQIWFILEDKSSGRHHRFNAAAFRIIGLLDGERTVNEAWQLVNDQLGDFAPTQDEVIQLLGQLHSADLLHSNAATDIDELFHRQEQHQNLKIKQRVSNPLSQKFPLWDPDDFLERHLPKVSGLFNWTIALTWLSIVLTASLLAAMHWHELGNNIIINTLSPYNLTLLFILYPGIKILHELGHAFTAKLEGGEVHEMGIVFMMFIPIPYINVSTVTHFRNKYKRMLVGAAGIIVELLLASLALFIWLMAEPGIVRDIAFNIMLIGGVSSLFFNGNPLLKYDGYYVLADAIDIPNLFQRSAKYWGYLCQRYLFGLKQLASPAYTSWESSWFILYSLLSMTYRMALLWFIIVYVTDKFFAIGIVLALWLVMAQVVLPLFNMLRFIAASPSIQKKRCRVIGSCGALLAVLMALISIVPFPSYTLAEGIVWVPDNAQLRAESDGFSGPLLTGNNSQVDNGTDILQLEDPFLQTQVEIQLAKLKELEANYRAEKFNDLIKAQILKEQIPAVQAELANAQKNVQSMQLKSATQGQLLIPDADDLPGQFLKQGDLIGYVINNSLPIVRTVVTQDDMGKLQAGTERVQIRLVNHLDQVIPAKIIRIIPEATNRLPSAALATSAGGRMILDPDRTEDLVTLENFFLVDVEFSPLDPTILIGTRTYVRFDHGGQALAKQWYRSLRQLFLRQFNV